jgi:hypothetical protein
MRSTDLFYSDLVLTAVKDGLVAGENRAAKSDGHP